MSSFKSGFIARLVMVVLAGAISALLVIGCGGDGGGGGNPSSPNNTDSNNSTNPSNNDDNYTYSGGTVDIGGKTWMSKNLDRAMVNSWCYDNDNSNCAKYGRLYTWDAAMAACPSPWRLPTSEDWDSLTIAAGKPADSSSVTWVHKLLDQSWGGLVSWYDGVNSTGFSALPGGDKTGDSFGLLGTWGFWWTATETWIDSPLAYCWIIAELAMFKYSQVKSEVGMSVRCIQD